MIVDCDRCEVRGNACQDCVITVLLGPPGGGILLDATERRALDVLAEAGLVPQLRLVSVDQPTASRTAADVAGWAVERDERSGRKAV